MPYSASALGVLPPLWSRAAKKPRPVLTFSDWVTFTLPYSGTSRIGLGPRGAPFAEVGRATGGPAVDPPRGQGRRRYRRSGPTGHGYGRPARSVFVARRSTSPVSLAFPPIFRIRVSTGALSGSASQLLLGAPGDVLAVPWAGVDVLPMARWRTNRTASRVRRLFLPKGRFAARPTCSGRSQGRQDLAGPRVSRRCWSPSAPTFWWQRRSRRLPW